MENIYENINSMRQSIRNLSDNKEVLNEETETSTNMETSDKQSVPYTNQDELMSTTLQVAKAQFGASFDGLKNPMLYYPSDGDVTLSGMIPGLGGDVKFQFRYKDSSGNGCYIWSNYLVLSDNTLNVLKRINGVYKNWRQELDSAEDIKPMGYKNSEEARRGDDID